MKSLFQLLALGAALAPSIAYAQSIQSTTVLAPLAGPNYTPASGQSGIGFWGTDLGYTFKHNGNLRVLFGDTHADDAGTLIGWGQDDAQGTISLAAFPNGNAVDAYIASHPAPAGAPSWQSAAPPVTFRTNLFGTTAPMTVLRDGMPLDMAAFRAPTGAFSNAIDAAFGIFDRNVVTQCSGGFSPSCGGGLTCDRGMGSCFPFSGENSIPCVIGTASCLCLPVSGGGMCQDRSSSLYNTTEPGRTMSIALRIEVANASPLIDEVYYSQPWSTNKLINSTVRTVDDFDPSRANGVGNNYNPANGAGVTSREKVFLWGRPSFVGANAASLSAKLYFAYVDMPRYAASGKFAWAPKYFTGLDANGRPQFSTSQSAAVALDLGFPGDATREKFDIVNQMAVSWVPSLNKWMMLYGGDLPPNVVQFFLGTNAPLAVRDPQGAIHARFASQPWGPWSAPVSVFAGGDPAASPPVAGSQYGANGVLFHPSCSASTCADDASPAHGDYGRLYGANIIDAWTTQRGPGAVDIYWNASTWNPYQVVLMRTRVTTP
jgi:hypothetical protein